MLAARTPGNRLLVVSAVVTLATGGVLLALPGAEEPTPERSDYHYTLVPLSGDVLPSPAPGKTCVPFLAPLVAHPRWQLQIARAHSGCMGEWLVGTFSVSSDGKVGWSRPGMADRELELSPEQLATVRGLDRLSPEDRAQAERNLQKWREMTPEQRQRAVDNYRQWQSLSPEERQTARQNDQRLRRMSPADRARVQEDFQRFQSLSPERQRELNAAHDRFQRLPLQQQQLLRERLQRYQTMSPDQRERFERNVERWRRMTPTERQQARDQIRQQRPPEGDAPPQYRRDNRPSGPGGGYGRPGPWQAPYGRDRHPGGPSSDEGRPGPGPGPRGGGRGWHWSH